jgi:uncharacterized protein (UPF0332 family)
MTWDDMAIDLLQAAKMLLVDHPRSAASRAYYAAHIALAKQLQANGFVPGAGQSTHPHLRQVALIDRFLSHMGQKRVAELRRVFRRLYSRRIDADYVRRVTFDYQTALESVRDASVVFATFNMRE